MTIKKTKILFLTPFAGRTGSEMLLWYFLKRFDRKRFEAAVVSFANGELLVECPADVPCFVVSKRFNIWQKIQFKYGKNPIEQALLRIQEKTNADSWYVNTLMLPEVYTVLNT